jgi:hypothetical protein
VEGVVVVAASSANPEPSPGLDTLSDMVESQGSPEDLTQQQVPLLRNLFEEDSGLGLWLFAYHICGCKDITMVLHYEECQFLSMWGKIELKDGTVVERPQEDRDDVLTNWRRLHMCVPRDTFKTTLGTRATVTRAILRNPEITCGIFNESEAKSKSWVGSIKQIIEQSRLLQVLWKDVLPPGVHYSDDRSVPRSWKWGDSGIALVRDSINVSELTVEPFGIGGASAGKHFTHKVLDDIIGEASATSEAIMADAVHWIDNARALERPSDRGCELVNYTRWAYFDVYRHMLEKWPDEYQVYHRSLLENAEGEPDVVTGKSIFPERFPTSLCKKMYEEDPFTFMSQRQCIPQAGRDTNIDKAWVRHGKVTKWSQEDMSFLIHKDSYDPTLMLDEMVDIEGQAPNQVMLSDMDKAIVLDPAPPPSGRTKINRLARNGIVVIAMDGWGRRYGLEAVPLREDPIVVLDKIIELCQKWTIDKVGIEEVNFSQVYIPLWTALLAQRQRSVRIEFIPVTTKNKDKDYRIREMAAEVKSGLWYFNQEEFGHAEVELLEYPYCRTRDLIDAMAYAPQVLMRPQTTEERHHLRKQQEYTDLGRDRYTGY